jgi:ParB family chromosome partitioning protein
MGFNINAFLNEESKKDMKSDWKPVKVSARKLRPAPDKTNFYHAEDKEIKDLAESIELIGLQQYPVIRPVEGTDEYEVIAGHKRRLAILRLLDEGKAEYEMIPCKVEPLDSIRNELILIFTNSTQRERTDYEKMREIERVRELLKEYQKTHELTGRRQSIIAGILGTNKTKVGTLDNINNNLIEPFKEEFAVGKISTSTANKIAGLEPDAQQALYETYKATGTLIAKDAKALKEVFPDDLPEELKAEVRQYAAETGISLEDAAGVIRERHERAQEMPQEPPKEEKAENTPEPKKGQETPQDESESGFMNEPETKVTYNAPAPDNTDRKSLIINGKINMHKEYNGMVVDYFISAVIGSDLFDTEFWQGWKKCVTENCENPKALYIADYAGTATTYTVQTDRAEKCKAVLTDTGLEVLREAVGQTAVISYEELAELIDIMIYTKVIEIKTIESDLKYWAYWTAKELVPISDYLTESEIYVLQDLMMRCKERAGK